MILFVSSLAEASNRPRPSPLSHHRFNVLWDQTDEKNQSRKTYGAQYHKITREKTPHTSSRE